MVTYIDSIHIVHIYIYIAPTRIMCDRDSWPEQSFAKVNVKSRDKITYLGHMEHNTNYIYKLSSHALVYTINKLQVNPLMEITIDPQTSRASNTIYILEPPNHSYMPGLDEICNQLLIDRLTPRCDRGPYWYWAYGVCCKTITYK